MMPPTGDVADISIAYQPATPFDANVTEAPVRRENVVFAAGKRMLSAPAATIVMPPAPKLQNFMTDFAGILEAVGKVTLIVGVLVATTRAPAWVEAVSVVLALSPNVPLN